MCYHYIFINIASPRLHVFDLLERLCSFPLKIILEPSDWVGAGRELEWTIAIFHLTSDWSTAMWPSLWTVHSDKCQWITTSPTCKQQHHLIILPPTHTTADLFYFSICFHLNKGLCYQRILELSFYVELILLYYCSDFRDFPPKMFCNFVLL